ncbi:hypothetical protein BVX99_01520 [bacterium F16]|nr:hypothetical protein BVX99_01520 [bacterium F16]
MLTTPPVRPFIAPPNHLTSRAKKQPVLSISSRAPATCVASAIVYCEANFGDLDGKTANGLIRRSEKYKILSVIDSKQAGLDTGRVKKGPGELYDYEGVKKGPGEL